MAKKKYIPPPEIRKAYITLSQAMKLAQEEQRPLSIIDMSVAGFLLKELKRRFGGRKEVKDLALLVINDVVARRVLNFYDSQTILRNLKT